MSYEHILTEIDDRFVGHITLNRPEQLNTFTTPLAEELYQALLALDSDPQVRVVLLKGAGKVAEAIQKEFSVEAGGTSPDRKFTFKLVNCVGACALAPVMIVDGTYYDAVTADSAISILCDIAEGKTVTSKA